MNELEKMELEELNNVPEKRDYEEELLSIIRSDLSSSEIREKLTDYHDNDIASVLEELEAEERDRLHNALGSEAMSDVVPYLEDAGEYLAELEAEEAADIIEQMDADEALEVLDDLDEKTRIEVMELIEDEEVKEEIELLDSYDDDEFGSKMSTNFISIKKSFTIKGAMRKLIAEAAENDNIYTIFVTEDDGVFYGAIDLKDLIVARSTVDISELIYTAFPYVCDKDIISDNIERVKSYSEELIPVVSSENGVLLGVITSSDITEMVDEELAEDYAKFAALGSEQEPDETLFGSMKKRIPWLIALLFMGLAVSAVVGLFEGVVDELPMIVSFQSLILGMAGNVGTQSLAVTVRLLGTEEQFGWKKQLLTILKEMRVALLNGVALGLVSFGIVSAYLFAFANYGASFTLMAAVCVGLAMCFAMTVSGLTGALIPIVLYRCKIDPAVASGPLITTVNDLVAVVSYYGLAWTLLIGL